MRMVALRVGADADLAAAQVVRPSLGLREQAGADPAPPIRVVYDERDDFDLSPGRGQSDPPQLHEARRAACDLGDDQRVVG